LRRRSHTDFFACAVLLIFKLFLLPSKEQP
jgi:hypothetical protein